MKIIAYLDVFQQEEVFPNTEQKPGPRDPRPEDPDPIIKRKIYV
jgi:hypothetical protein